MRKSIFWLLFIIGVIILIQASHPILSGIIGYFDKEQDTEEIILK